MYWISLPASWALEDVQAGLNVVVAFLSTLGIFTFVRTCWQKAARRVALDQDVPLPSLLSTNTIGEALDLFLLLQKDLLKLRYCGLLAQCLVVVCLTATALVSGPIARYSTRRGDIVREADVAGFLASRQHNGIGYANVEWNMTHERLDKAGFPLDQLVDYLPDNSVDWAFDASQWNNSWTLNCSKFPETTVELETSGNCSFLQAEIPGLSQIYDFNGYESIYWQSSGFYDDQDNVRDELIFVTGINETDYVEADDTYVSLALMVTAIYMHNTPRNQNQSSGCLFGVGAAHHSSYTKFECSIRRRGEVLDYNNLAYPDINSDSHNILANAYTAYYAARLAQESTSGVSITIIQPDELIRFYQTYTITKDLQYRQPVTRRINVNQVVVQISTIFLVIAGLLALLIALGLFNFAIFALCHPRTTRSVPQSKLDWMIQSIQAEDRPLTHRKRAVRRTVTVQTGTDGEIPVSTKSEFEAARYGRIETTTWFLRDSAATTELGSPPMIQGLSPQFTQTTKRPLLGQNFVS